MKEQTKKLIESIIGYIIAIVIIAMIPILVCIMVNNNANWQRRYKNLYEDYLIDQVEWTEEWTEMDTASEFIERLHQMEIEHLTELYEVKTQVSRVYITVENDGDFELIWKDDGGWNYIQTLGGVVVEERCFGFVDEHFIDGFLDGRLATFYEIG